MSAKLNNGSVGVALAMLREVLECANPLALWLGGCSELGGVAGFENPKRQRTGALQNAIARKSGSLP